MPIAQYCTIDELAAHLQVTFKDSEQVSALQKIKSASASIDDYLNIPSPGYFMAATGQSVKRVRGSGDSFLNLPAPINGSVTITAPTGSTVPNYDLDAPMRLITLDEYDNPSPYIVWDANIFYQITGAWGYPEIPPQINEACMQLAAHFWRVRDKGFKGIVTNVAPDEAFPERDFPRTVRRILDEFNRGLGQKPGGGLYIA